ncbi:MAG: hypothetical protein Q8Q41_00390 [bacterium]|nr:hypothetical protein [bacterium]
MTERMPGSSGPEEQLPSALEAGLKRRGIELPKKEEPRAPKAQEGNELKTSIKIAHERAEKIAAIKETGRVPEKGAPEVTPLPERVERAPRSRMEVIKTRAFRFARVAVLAGLALLTPTFEQPAKGSTGGAKGISATVSERTTRSSGLEIPGAHFTFLEKGADGKTRFNWWSLLAPAQVELGREIAKATEKTFVIPYEYSRLFEKDPAAKRPLRVEDHEKVAEFTEEALKKKFVDLLYGLDMNKRVYELHHGQPESRAGKITSIKITGTASPEGPRSKGPQTLAAGNVDVENIKLAQKRAEAAVHLTKEEWGRISRATGVSEEVLEKAVQNIDAKEVQFSPQEHRELSLIAQSYPGSDDLEKIYNLVCDYNDGKIKDRETVSMLDALVGAKRSVEIAVTFGGGQTDRLLVPIPWLLLLPLAFPALKRRMRQGSAATPVAPSGEQSPVTAPSVAAPSGELPVRRESVSGMGNGRLPSTLEAGLKRRGIELPYSAAETPQVSLLDVIPQMVKDIELPETESREYQGMEERAYVSDLYVFFDDSDAIRRGINYRVIADEMYRNFDSLKDGGERELVLSYEILKAWKAHDRECRKEAGVSEGELEAGLNYEEQPNQIKWSKMHARALLKLIEEKRKLPVGERETKDYLDMLSPHVRKLLKRQVTAGK